MKENQKKSVTQIVFLAYSSKDSVMAERIAEMLMQRGIDVWWDKWCIRSGDSLRRKVDGGIKDCTHFAVLLTEDSVRSSWVNKEMDAGFMKELGNKCKFIPLRYEFAVSNLPPTLAGIMSPKINEDTMEEDIDQLANDIRGITHKPPLGKPSYVLDLKNVKTGYSPAANTVAKVFVENSKHGSTGDLQYDIETIAEKTGLTILDTEEAVDELSSFFQFHHSICSSSSVMAKASLYVKFDQYWKDWNPQQDALKLAADMISDETFPTNSHAIAQHYRWKPRRLNPAVVYLAGQGVLHCASEVGRYFEYSGVIPHKVKLRRFVKKNQ